MIMKLFSLPNKNAYRLNVPCVTNFCLTAICALSMTGKQALAQETENTTTTTAPTELSTKKSYDLANPAFYFGEFSLLGASANYLAPQIGTEVEVSYIQTLLKINSNFPNSQSRGEFNDSTLNVKIGSALIPNLTIGLNFNSREMKDTNEFSSTFSSTQKNESKISGTSDPVITVNKRLEWGPAALILGLNGGISSGNSEEKNLGPGASEGNNKSGGNFVMPHLSVFSNTKTSVMIGFSTAYNFLQERTLTSVSTSGLLRKSFTSEGNQFHFTTFMETPSERMDLGRKLNFRLGANLNYLRAEKSKYRDEASTVTNEGSPFSLAYFTVYSQIDFNRYFAMVPSFGYGQLIEMGSSDTTTVLQKDIFLGSISGKASF
jgi:hypothetical protein